MKNSYKKQKIALIGYGTMGKILFEILYKMNSFEKLYVIDKDLNKINKEGKKFSKNIIFSDKLEDCLNCDILILAIKPQDFRNISLTLKNTTLVISIMAGVSMKELIKTLNAKKIIRAMPNMPAKIKKGVIGYFVNKNVSKKEKSFAQKLFSEMGTSFCVFSEKEIDMITAVSGSGPAYVFYMLDCFTKATNSIGLDNKITRNIVLETFKGSLALIDKNTDFSLLIKNVASKGGTTEAALREFNRLKTEKIWKKAIHMAYERAKQLSRFE